jgi:Fe2+ or Zn2+ uptake regulation protein
VNHPQLAILRLLKAKRDAMSALELVRADYHTLKISSVYVHLDQLIHAGEVTRLKELFTITPKGEQRISNQ